MFRSQKKSVHAHLDTEHPKRNDGSAVIQACQAGDRDGQRQIYESHCHTVHRLMYRMVGPDDADDLTQQVFLRVFQVIEQYAGRSAFSTWLYRLAVNEALQFIRRNQRRSVSNLVMDPPDHSPSTQTQLDHRDSLELALNRLEPDLRSIFLLREVDKLSYYEIALTLDIAEGTVASRLNRARRQLRTLLRGCE